MRPHHRTAVLVVIVGLVVGATIWTSGSAALQTRPQNALRAATGGLHGLPVAVPVSSTQDPDFLALGRQVLDEQQAAIDALSAQQAQALADQLQAAATRLQQAPGPRIEALQVTPPSSGDCYGVNPYAAYIYQRESGCNPGSVNSSGCAGIGQACPGSKMPCSLTDAPCQLAYFEDYALGRYGSWEAAYQFWQFHSWW